jgi:glycosyltransferase involved in cell wall biosynthesis
MNKTTAVIIGSFPPPVHGASTINQSLFELLQMRGVSVLKIDLSPLRAKSSGYHLTRIFRVIMGTCRILFAAGGTERRYMMSVDGGAGLLYNILLALAVRFRGRPLLLYHHSSEYICSNSRLMPFLLKATGGGAIHVMCSARMWANFRQRYHVHAHAFVVNNGAWVTLPSLNDHEKTGKLRLGHLSGLTEEKGLGRVIETFRAVRRRNEGAELVLAGAPQDPAAQSTIAQAQAEFGDALRYVGVLTGDAKEAFYKDLDYFLFPSLYPHETQSLVVPEALAAGIPVIAHDHRFVGEVLGRGGCLIPVDSSFATIATEWIFSGDSIERRAAARAQVERVREEARGQIDRIVDWAAGTVPPAENRA